MSVQVSSQEWEANAVSEYRWRDVVYKEDKLLGERVVKNSVCREIDIQIISQICERKCIEMIMVKLINRFSY